ncbi:MAG: hypothetical protein EBX92_08715 [Actinobacteria bacterium]|nr:hypothetical protein [Actinomycetota bacterium]
MAEGGQHGVIQKIILLQAAHVFVGFLAKEHYVQVINAKPLPTVRESELRPRTSVNAATGRSARFPGLESDEDGDVSASSCPQGRRRKLFRVTDRHG